MSDCHITENSANAIDLRGYVREGKAGKPEGCNLSVSAYRTFVPARRVEAETEVFKQEMQIRAGIEGTGSARVRGHGHRRSRYRGRRENQLQALFAAATNLKPLTHLFFCFCLG